MTARNPRRKPNTGQPVVATGEVRVRVDQCIVSALDKFTAKEGATRPQAVRFILADWLRTHGYKITFSAKPHGPATEVVRMMDDAIETHRNKRKPKGLSGPSKSQGRR